MALCKTSGPLPSIDFSPLDAFWLATALGPMPAIMPSVGSRASTIPTQFCSFFISFFLHTMMSMMPFCMAGPGPGLVSGMPMGACRSGKGSGRMLIQGQPASRCGIDPTFQNGLSVNSIGMSTPSQTVLLNPTG